MTVKLFWNLVVLTDKDVCERLAASGAFDGYRPLRYGGSCHNWAELLESGLENVTFTGRQL